MPEVMLKRAWSPSAVLNPGKGASGAACAFGKSGKQTRADRIVANMTFRFFIDLVLFFHCFWPYLISRSAQPSTRKAKATPCHFMSSRSLIPVAVLPKGRWYVKGKTRGGLIIPTDQIGVAKMFSRFVGWPSVVLCKRR
jgi:hypothetical protein